MKGTVVILLQGAENVNPSYAFHAFGEQFKQFGYDLEYIATDQQHNYLLELDQLNKEKGITLIFGHNLKMLRNLNTTNQQIVDRLKNVKIFDWMDTPLNKVKELEKAGNNYVILSMDKTYLPLIRDIRKLDGSEFFLPAVGNMNNADFVSESTLVPFDKRKYDVLFAGRLGIDKFHFNEFGRLERKAADELVEQAFLPTNMQMHEYVNRYFEKYRKRLVYRKKPTSDAYLNYVWKLSHVVRSKRRQHVLDELFELPVDVNQCFVTDSTEYVKDRIQDQHQILPFQPWTEIIDLMKQSRIIINIQPFHIYALHERLLTAMANGCLVFTDRNPYLEERFKDGKDLIFYDYNKGDLKAKMQHYIQQPELMQQIAINGMKKVRENDMPEHRVKRILEIMANLSN
jgi:glycosyltransferase involved in cell wall biosynthesis